MRVEPIKNTKEVRKIINYLIKENRIRDLILFELGIYTGLRISDILALKVGDIKNGEILKKEKKTGKYKRIELHNELKVLLEQYIKNKSKEEYLIKSRVGENKPISATQAYRIIKGIAKVNRLRGNYGTHSLRKTYGVHLYKNNDISVVQRALNHESQKETLRYIGVEEQEINKAVCGLNYN